MQCPSVGLLKDLGLSGVNLTSLSLEPLQVPIERHDDGGGLGGFTELQRLCWFLRKYDGELREPLVWRQGS